MNSTAPPLFALPSADDAGRHGFSARDALRLFFKHLGVILTATVLVTTLIWAGLKIQPKVYEGSAKVWIKTEQQAMPAFLTGIAGLRDNQALDPVNRRIETEMELIRSRDSAERVIERLRLRPEQLRTAPMEVVRQQIAPTLEALRRVLGLAASGQASEALQRQQLVDEFLNSLNIEPQRSKGADTTSNVVEVRFAAADPEVIPQVIQAVLDEYLQLAARQNRRLGENTLALLETKAGEARKELRESEAQLLGFLSTQGDRAGRPGGGRQGPAELSAGGGSVVGQLKTQAVDLQRRMDELRQVYTEEAENVKSLSRSIDQLQARIRSEMRATAEADGQIATLERQRALAQERFVELRKRMDQIDLYLSVNPTESESRVLTQQPSRPLVPDTKRQTLLKLLAPVLGVLLGLTLAALRELLDRRVQTPEDVERFLGQRLLAALPALSVERVPGDTFADDPVKPILAGDSGGAMPPPERPAAGRSLEALFESNRVSAVRARDAASRDLLIHGLAQRVRDLMGASAGSARARAPGDGRILLVTSARPGEGKSCVARALAKRLAVQDGGRVLVIDANAQAPAGHGGAGSQGTGFFDLLRDKEAHARVVPSRCLKQLHMLPAGRRPEPDLLFHEPALSELFERTRARYAWTLIDAGVLPLTGGLSAFADGVVVVVDATSTRREVVQGSLAAARLSRERLLGVVLNRRPQYVPSWLYRGWL